MASFIASAWRLLKENSANDGTQLQGHVSGAVSGSTSAWIIGILVFLLVLAIAAMAAILGLFVVEIEGRRVCVSVFWPASTTKECARSQTERAVSDPPGDVSNSTIPPSPTTKCEQSEVKDAPASIEKA